MMKKRFLAILMTLTLLLPMIPASTFADDVEGYTITIQFDAGGGDGEMDQVVVVWLVDGVIVVRSEDGYIPYVLPSGENIPFSPPEGMEFNGWELVDEIPSLLIKDGILTIDEGVDVAPEITITATWRKTYAVTFRIIDADVLEQTVSAGGTAVVPNMTREGYTLDGWYTDDAFTAKFSFDTPIDEDITLYAKWIKEVDPVPAEPDGLTWAKVAVLLVQYGKLSAVSGFPLPDGCEDLSHEEQAAIAAVIQAGWAGESGFCPTGVVTRAEMASVLADHVLELDTDAYANDSAEGVTEEGKDAFNDISGDYVGAVRALYASGIIPVAEDKQFHPEDPITEEEAKTWLDKALSGNDLSEGDPSDEKSPGSDPSESDSSDEKSPGSDPSESDSSDEKSPGSNPSGGDSSDEKSPGSNPSDGDSSDEKSPGSNPSEGDSPDEKSPGSDPSEGDFSDNNTPGSNPSEDDSSDSNSSGNDSFESNSSSNSTGIGQSGGNFSENISSGSDSHNSSGSVSGKPDSSGGTVTGTKKDVTTIETDGAGNRVQTVKKTDGSTVIMMDNKDGSKSTTHVSAAGKAEVTASLSASAVNAAQNRGEVVTLVMPRIKAGHSFADAPVVTVSTGSSTAVRVEIPMADVTVGTVAVIVNADGTSEAVKTSLVTDNGIIVALTDGATVKIVDNAKTFTDIAGHWACSAIDFVSAREIFSGTAGNLFSPDSSMTRAMMVLVLARYEGADVSGGATWYEKGVQWAQVHGISDGSNPDGQITREQLAAMLWRYAGQPEPRTSSLSFKDADQVNDYAVQALCWAVENGIINGYGDDILNPGGPATRAQVATMLMRYILL